MVRARDGGAEWCSPNTPSGRHTPTGGRGNRRVGGSAYSP
jgi:hypothetical protein